jgi:iron(III) transport system permease protein
VRLVPARSAFPLTVATAALAFLGLFFLYPLFRVFAVSFIGPPGTGLTLANYAHVLSTAFYRASVTNSLLVGAAATATTVAIGVPMAFILARVSVPGRTLVLALSTLPLALPSFVGAYAWVLLLGRSGLVTQALRAAGLPHPTIYGAPGLVLVYTLTMFPYVLLPTLAAFKAVDVSIEEAGQNLGASRWRVLRTVTIPVIMPAILSGGLLVMMEALENFGVPFVLAEDKPIMAVEAYKLFIGETGANPASAGALGVLLVACTTAVLLLQRYYLARRRFATAARRTPPEIKVGAAGRMAAAAFVWAVILVALIPFFAVVVVACMKFRGPVLQGGFSFGNFAELLDASPRPLVNTLLLATAAAAGATALGVPIGYVLTRYRSPLSHVLDTLATAPFAVAGTVLGIGLILSFNAGALVLTGGWLILVLAYMVRKLPFSVRSSSAILHQIDPSLEEASINLGVSPTRTFFTLTVPLMLGGILGGSVLAWVTIASELSSTVMLYSGPWATMTVVMFQALEGTSAGVASAAATVLIVVTIVPLLLVYGRLRRQEGALL